MLNFFLRLEVTGGNVCASSTYACDDLQLFDHVFKGGIIWETIDNFNRGLFVGHRLNATDSALREQGGTVMSVSTKELQDSWASISLIITIRNEREYDQAIKRLNGLIDEIGTNERHPLYGLLDTLGTLIHAYEEKNFPAPEVSGREMLRFFMDEHSLRETELPELGSERSVSEILRGKRELNAKQIRSLAAQFHVSPAVFV